MGDDPRKMDYVPKFDPFAHINSDDLTMWMLRLSEDDFGILRAGLHYVGPNIFTGIVTAVDAIRKADKEDDRARG